MKRNPVAVEDRRSIAEWFSKWGERVADVDFIRVRDMFVKDAVAFGSKVEMVTALDTLAQLPQFRGCR
jgi:hypothetical protein